MIDEKQYTLPNLPKPEPKWKPIVRRSKHVPFGYEVDPNDEDILLPVEFELELLEEAKKHLKQYSYRAVAAWLSEASGRSISHMGLRNRIESERKNKRKAQGYYVEAKRLEKIIEKIRFLESEVPGSRIGPTRADEFDTSGTETCGH